MIIVFLQWFIFVGLWISIIGCVALMIRPFKSSNFPERRDHFKYALINGCLMTVSCSLLFLNISALGWIIFGKTAGIDTFINLIFILSPLLICFIPFGFIVGTIGTFYQLRTTSLLRRGVDEIIQIKGIYTSPSKFDKDRKPRKD